MPITVTATPGDDSANSYASVADADAYAANSVGPSAAAWVTESDDDKKAQALITATRDIDTLLFIGERATSTQALEWPRADAVTLYGREYDVDELPPSLVAATIELAIYYLANSTLDVVNPVARDKKSIKADDVAIEWFAPSPAPESLEWFPRMVQRYLLQLVVTAAVAGWGGSVQERVS